MSSDADTKKDTASRLVELESHFAHQDRMIQDLSDMVARQWDTINDVLRKLEGLESQMRASQDQDVPTEEPPPPHY